MSSPKQKLDYNVLSQYFIYEPTTGKFFRKVQAGNYKAGSEVIVKPHHTGYSYVSVKIDGNKHNISLHRVAWTLYNKSKPVAFIDHINHDKSDNRIKNLREVTKTENNRNKSKSPLNTSGHTGISWHSRDNIWEARIKVDYKQRYIGRFDNIEDAINARKQAEVEYGFHANHGKGR